jgi:primosomal protein N' (replication factor Y) (superfamily II helicase)
MTNRSPDTFVEVAVDAPAGPGRTFSYSVPPHIAVKPGQLVTVPFGPRTVQGLIVALTNTPQVSETRDIVAADPSGPLLSEEHLDLAKWIGDYYICSLFDAAAPMLPPGGRFRIRTYLEATDDSADGTAARLTPYQEQVLDYVRSRERVDETRLTNALGQPARAAAGRLVDLGLLRKTQGRSTAAVGHRRREYVRPSKTSQADPSSWQSGLSTAPRQAEAMQGLLDHDGPMTLAEAAKRFGRAAVASLVEKGLVERDSVEESRDPLLGRHFAEAGPVTLTKEQAEAAAAVKEALERREPATLLLEGVTGSGKTEVYLDAVQRCIETGRRAIVMVPEISLTPQTVERFASRFPGDVAVLHSGLSSGERFDQWWKVKAGEYDVVVGSRSAVFAPLQDLGLVVIDEEHEWTYKQHDSVPRYHARAVALRLAQSVGATVLLGSASPDVQSYNRALRGGVTLLRLSNRFTAGEGEDTGSRLAAVEVVDMRAELRRGNSDMLSSSLHAALQECMDSGAQAILFLNRRGSASTAQCRSCGFMIRCRSCDVSMAFHGDTGRLMCHYCGSRRVPPTKCPECLRYRIGYTGVGTKGVADRIEDLFPEVGVMRWDRDSVTSVRGHQEMLERFRAGEARVLIGTQMIAKGLHFPSVTLVGAVQADVGLAVPDYRAGERTFQLLFQVAGRSGRGAPGRVIIQTYQPENYAIRAAAAQDYRRFYEEELSHRREHGNPPFGRLVRLTYTHLNKAKCEQEAVRLVKTLSDAQEEWGLSDVAVLGPMPAYPTRLRGQYRWQVTLRGAKPRTLLDRVVPPSGWTIDVDPVAPG